MPIAAAEEARVQPTAVAAADPKPAEDDYYTRRARSILEAEKSAAPQPHPLAARYPGMNVVVCEAGCPGEHGPEAVYARPVEAAKVASESMMVPTSGQSDAVAAASSAVVCVAGCYDGTGSGPEPQHFAVGDWATTTVETERPRDKLSPIR